MACTECQEEDRKWSITRAWPQGEGRNAEIQLSILLTSGSTIAPGAIGKIAAPGPPLDRFASAGKVPCLNHSTSTTSIICRAHQGGTITQIFKFVKLQDATWTERGSPKPTFSPHCPCFFFLFWGGFFGGFYVWLVFLLWESTWHNSILKEEAFSSGIFLISLLPVSVFCW